MRAFGIGVPAFSVSSMINPSLIGAIAGISTLFGLISFIAYLYFRQQINGGAERSVMEIARGKNPAFATQIVEILKTISTPEKQVEALKLLLDTGNAESQALLSKIQGNINLELLNREASKKYLWGSGITAILFLSFAVAGLVYSYENTQPTSSDTHTSVRSPTIAYTYRHPVQGSVCTGRIEKSGDTWQEYLPVDGGCKLQEIEAEDLGSDDNWFYFYESNRNMTARLPRKDGNVNWTTNRIPPSEAASITWGTSQPVIRVR
jgi:hypothetical protein